MRVRRSRVAACVLAVALALAAAAAACGDGDTSGASTGEAVGPLRIGLLLNFSGTSNRSVERRQAFELAVKHVNAAGGVFGLPVETVMADSTQDPETAAAAARRLVEEEGVHAIVGPSSSANSLLVIERVSAPLGIPTVSPSATSPLLTATEDGDFFFRTTISDVAQGPVLADQAKQRDFRNVGLIYRSDAWGQGLADAFRDAWDGDIRVAAVKPGADSYLPQLRDVAGGGAQALILATFNTEGAIIIREALQHGLFDQFGLGDALSPEETLADIAGLQPRAMFGTAATAAPGVPSTMAWQEAYVAGYGALPQFAFTMESYDAAVVIALAAQAAGSVDGAAIRDRLRAVGGEGGEVVIAGAAGVAEAFQQLREGGAINFEGAASTLDWDENGDLVRGTSACGSIPPPLASKDSASSTSTDGLHPSVRSP